MSNDVEVTKSGRLTLKARTRLDGDPGRSELDPLRRVLAALSDSLAETYRTQAHLATIPLDEIDVRVEAGLDPGATPPGHLRVEVRLRSPADINELEQLRVRAGEADPVLALLRAAIPTRLEIALDLRDTRSIAA